MSTTSRRVEATPEHVWEVLGDGWLYPLWVVGASRMREVDDGWPAPGSRLHHSVGSWPLLLDDRTEVLRCEPPAVLELRAHGWPAGHADVTIHVQPLGEACEIAVEEHASGGPGVLVPRVVQDPLIHWRNTESLRRLAFLCERRPRG